MTRDATSAQIDPKLLELLCCPLTNVLLQFDPERSELISLKARLAFPVRDGIPIMLPSEARPLDEAEYARRKGRRPS